MGGYRPINISGNETGLVQSREEFLLPNDAYPLLQNAYVWRERLLRKKGYSLLGRLQRNIGNTNGSGNATINITPIPIQSGIASFVIGTDVFVDPGGASPITLLTNSSGSATLNRTTGVLTITGSQATTGIQYFPGLPVMGICKEEKSNSLIDNTVFFDQDYAYVYNSGSNQFQEFIPGTTWNAHNANTTGTDFFWSTNYWVSSVAAGFGTSNVKLMWVTNNTGQYGVNSDPIRITDGSTWVNFQPPNYGQIDTTNFVVNCLAFLPFRGRLVMFNTWEGTNAANAANFPNRIRWSTIGNPFLPFAAGPPATGSWRDDIRGQGGFLDIPISEDIVSVGFVRDNLVIYCEHSTWQLRYTGRSIAPFQIERVNSELGAQSLFGSIQFDTSLTTFGDKGILECDSYQANRIDIKIPDFVFQLNFANNGSARIQGIRDFQQRLAYWTIPYAPDNSIFPTQRLVYNYENDSWALFNDSLTALGTFQATSSRNWVNTHIPWIKCNFPWIGQPVLDAPDIVGGNQQGFIEVLDQQTVNDVSLFISNITGNNTTATTVISPNHNMQTDFVIQISGIVGGTSNFSNLNGGIFSIVVIDTNTFNLFTYNINNGQFDIPQTDPSSNVYQGGGLINIRENFSIISKKFNFMDEGQSIQLGYLDILMNPAVTSTTGAISLNVYLNYDGANASNILPNNSSNDTFFNSIIPTVQSPLSGIGGSKFWQRVFCPTRANFLVLEYTFSNAQMNGLEQQQDVQIDAQILHVRPAGRLTQF